MLAQKAQGDLGGITSRCRRCQGTPAVAHDLGAAEQPIHLNLVAPPFLPQSGDCLHPLAPERRGSLGHPAELSVSVPSGEKLQDLPAMNPDVVIAGANAVSGPRRSLWHGVWRPLEE